MKKPNAPCPCGRMIGKRPQSYAECCGRYIEDYGKTPAPDAESLMRSRYTAFVLDRADYLLATWDPAHRPETLESDEGRKWLGLDVRRSHEHDAEHAEVEFVARSRVDGKGVRLHEKSRFVRRDGRWFYVDGDDMSAESERKDFMLKP